MPRRNERKYNVPGLKLDILELRRKYQILGLLGDEEVAEAYAAALVDTLSHKLPPCENNACEWKYIPKANFKRMAPEKAAEWEHGAFTCVICCRLRPATAEEAAEYRQIKNRRAYTGKYETFEHYRRRMKE